MRTAPLTVIALASLFLPGHAAATHTEPAKANKAKFELVNGFIPCDTPNTATQSNGTSACAPANPVSPCALSATGSGRMLFAKVGRNGTQDLKITGVATGLNANCEGEQFHIRLSYRFTTDDCPEGSCTSTDLTNIDLNGAFCVVSGGKCKIKTTLNAVASGLIATNGKNAGITILGCGLKGFGFLASPAELQCGVLLK